MIFHRLLLEAMAARASLYRRRIIGDDAALADLSNETREHIDWLHATYPWICPRGCAHPLPARPTRPQSRVK